MILTSTSECAPSKVTDSPEDGVAGADFFVLLLANDYRIDVLLDDAFVVTFGTPGNVMNGSNQIRTDLWPCGHQPCLVHPPNLRTLSTKSDPRFGCEPQSG